jgi:hypothetical protein
MRCAVTQWAELHSIILHVPYNLMFMGRSVHRESMSIVVQQDANMCSLLCFCKLFYMFRMVTPPSSGAHITAITAYGTGQASETAVCEVS